MYFPKNKIKTNLYAGKGEFYYADNLSPFTGYYYSLYNGKYFESKSPIKGNREIVPASLTETETQISTLGTPENPPGYSNDKTSLIITNSQVRKLPSFYYPQPTEKDYTTGQFRRYFCKKVNENIFLENININDISSFPDEKIAVNDRFIKPNGAYGVSAMVGAVGDILQYKLVQNGGNSYTNAQICVAKFVKESRTNITKEFIEWCEGKTDFPGVLINGGDTMGHFMKGNIGLFISSGNNITCNNVSIDGIINKGLGGMETENEYINEYLGNCSNGIIISGSDKIRLYNINIKNIISNSGYSCGINFIGKYSDIRGEFCKISNLKCGKTKNKMKIPNVEPISYKMKFENGKKGVKIIFD